MQKRGPLSHCLLDGEEHGKLFVIHLYKGEGVQGGLKIYCRNGCHVVPNVSHLVMAKERLIETALVISMIPPGHATPSAAFRFGTELARLHAAGSADFGAPWRGFIASLPLDNTALDNTQLDNTQLADAAAPWPQWYAQRRLLPFLRRAVDAGALRSGDARLVEAVIDRIGSVAGPAEPPSRIHGDCWAGNVLWSGGRGWLIDPAAHGGHRETDLAMLALFGAPDLDRILFGRQQAPGPDSAGSRRAATAARRPSGTRA
jgi:fructosamine-3-kinase